MPSIRYEAESQRQHPRYRLPMRALAKSKSFEVLDWSMGGFALAAQSEFSPGETIRAGLIIPFDGYELTIRVNAQVRYVLAEKGRVGFAFVELEERQASLLRYVSDAIISGEIVAVGDLVDVARRTGSGRTRNLPAAAAGRWQRFAGAGRRLASTAAVLVIVGALGSFLWANVYDELYLVRAESANVSAKLVNLASPAVGRIGYLNENRQVAIGEPLMTITPPAGNPITVQSPCDCIQVEQQFAGGDFVKTGDTVIRLMRADAPIVVSALVPGEQLMSLYGVKSANIVYADGSRVQDAGILWLPGQGDAQGNLPREPSTVVLDPRRELSADMMGQPVEVTFDLFPESALGRLVRAVARPVAGTAHAEPSNDAPMSEELGP